MATRVAVLGAGSWGTTIAALLAPAVPTTLWARRGGLADDLNSGRGNARYLPGFELPTALRATDDLSEAVSEADLVLVAVPTVGFRSVLEAASSILGIGVPVVSLAKGFERGSCLRMTQVIAEVLPRSPNGVLTGPNLAKEVLEGRSSAAVAASADPNVSQLLQDLLGSDQFRIYTNGDLVGCEIGGAVKNVIALAAGIAEGLDTGDNARAALITRGLAELTRLGEALGGQTRTLAGLAGMGDVLVTCISQQSRNRWVGEQIGSGFSPTDVLKGMNQIAEGMLAAEVVCVLASRNGVDVPIAEGVRAVVDDGRPPVEVWAELMARRLGPEVADF